MVLPPAEVKAEPAVFEVVVALAARSPPDLDGPHRWPAGIGPAWSVDLGDAGPRRAFAA
jgi:hypothetical protein